MLTVKQLNSLLDHSPSLDAIAYVTTPESITAPVTYRYIARIISYHPESTLTVDVVVTEFGQGAVERAIASHEGIKQMFGDAWMIESLQFYDDLPF